MLLWDDEAPPPKGDWIIVLWRSYGMDEIPEAVSIPRLVEEKADNLRERYLAWIYDLGETRIHGKRIIDHLQLRPGFSMWWMSLLTEKCNFAKSPQINDAIRLMAFDEWASERAVGRIVLASANEPLAECISLWCAKMGVAFERQGLPRHPVQLSWVRRIYQTLPFTLQALAWLARYLVKCWALCGEGLKKWHLSDGKMTFISYLFNMVPEATNSGRFESRYWAHLPDDLQREGCNTNWLHLYVKDGLLPTAKEAARVIRRFNESGQGQTHVTLATFLSLRIVIRTLRDWFRLARIGRQLERALCTPIGGELELWPLFRADWQRSFYGHVSMSNILFNNLFESAMRLLPKQRVGVYLQENQGWEFALIYAWKTAGHGHFIGTAHTPVKYWDLRSFYDTRCYLRIGENDLPLPDQVALNGPAALDAYRAGGYPEDDMVEVEALRYLHLAEDKTVRDPVLRPTAEPLRVLVLGDFVPSNTQLQMRLLEKAAHSLPADTRFIVKPHPNCPVRSAEYPSLRLQVKMDAISSLLGGCDVAYTSSTTSAAVDAYCAGVPVISVLDPKILNLSPLRGCDGVLFVSTPEELANALISAAFIAHPTTKQKDFFTLDYNLPRWRNLLRLTPST